MLRLLCGASFAAMCQRNMYYGQKPLREIISPELMPRYTLPVQTELTNLTKDFQTEEELSRYRKAVNIVVHGKFYMHLESPKTFYQQRREAFDTFFLYQLKTAIIPLEPDRTSFLFGVISLCKDGENIPLDVYFRSMGLHAVIAIRELLNISKKHIHFALISKLWKENPQCLNDLITLLSPKKATPGFISSLMSLIAAKDRPDDAHFSNIVPFVDTYLRMMSKDELTLDSIVDPETREIILSVETLADSHNPLSRFPALYYLSPNKYPLASETLFHGFKADIDAMFAKGVLPFQDSFGSSDVPSMMKKIYENPNLPPFYRDALTQPLGEKCRDIFTTFFADEYPVMNSGRKNKKLDGEVKESVYSEPMKEAVTRMYGKWESDTFMPYMKLVRAQWKRIDVDPSCPIFDLERLLNRDSFPWMQGERLNAVCKAASLCKDMSITVLHYNTLHYIPIGDVLANECPQKYLNNVPIENHSSPNLQSEETIPSSLIRNCLKSLSSIKPKGKKCLGFFHRSSSSFFTTPLFKQLLHEEVLEKDSVEALSALAPFGIDFKYLYRYLGSFRWEEFKPEILIFIIRSDSFASTVKTLPSSAAEKLFVSLMKSIAPQDSWECFRLTYTISDFLVKCGAVVEIKDYTLTNDMELDWLHLWSSIFPKLNVIEFQKTLKDAIPEKYLTGAMASILYRIQFLNAKGSNKKE